MIAIMAGIAIIAVAALAISGSAFALYRFKSHNFFVRAVGSIIPLPAAEMDGRFVTFREYAENFDSLKRFYGKQFTAGNFQQPAVQELQTQALERALFDAYVSDYARSHDIRVSSSAVSDELAQLTARQGGRLALNSFLKEWYGWSMREYAIRFLVPALRYKSVQDYVKMNHPDNIAAAHDAQEALSKLRSGEPFESVAAQYGQASGAERNGEPFTLSRGSLPSDIEENLDSYPDGTLTDVLTLDASMQILKILERDSASGLLRVQRIYIPLKTIEDLIVEQRTNAPVHPFIF